MGKNIFIMFYFCQYDSPETVWRTLRKPDDTLYTFWPVWTHSPLELFAFYVKHFDFYKKPKSASTALPRDIGIPRDKFDILVMRYSCHWLSNWNDHDCNIFFISLTRPKGSPPSHTYTRLFRREFFDILAMHDWTFAPHHQPSIHKYKSIVWA